MTFVADENETRSTTPSVAVTLYCDGNGSGKGTGSDSSKPLSIHNVKNIFIELQTSIPLESAGIAQSV